MPPASRVPARAPPPRPTDAVRAHWFAIPLLGVLEGLGARVVQVTLDEGEFHARVRDGAAPEYGDGPAADAEVLLRTDAETCRALAAGEATLAEAVESGRAVLQESARTGESI
ncbi:hypothetical protein ACGFRB_32695 [Streptomyces sp. NPDC048718]|uniref:hypothetical protein n=1 Tax=Streptomyces sp. NPDC048718 TaxID=3365587 RepID=UPI00371CEEF4